MVEKAYMALSKGELKTKLMLSTAYFTHARNSQKNIQLDMTSYTHQMKSQIHYTSV